MGKRKEAGQEVEKEGKQVSGADAGKGSRRVHPFEAGALSGTW